MSRISLAKAAGEIVLAWSFPARMAKF